MSDLERNVACCCNEYLRLNGEQEAEEEAEEWGAGVSQPRRNRIGALSVCVGSNSAANGGGVTRSPPRSERRSRMCVSELVGGFSALHGGFPAFQAAMFF